MATTNAAKDADGSKKSKPMAKKQLQYFEPSASFAALVVAIASWSV